MSRTAYDVGSHHRTGGPVASPVHRVQSDAQRRGGTVLVVFDLIALSAVAAVVAPSPAGALYVLNALVLLWHADTYTVPLQLDIWRFTTLTIWRLAGALLLPVPLLLVSRDAAHLVQATASILTLQCARGAAYAVISRMRRRLRWLERAVILGAGVLGHELAVALHAHPEYGIEVIGALDEVESTDELPVIGPPALLDDLIDDQQITHVLLAYGPFNDAHMVAMVRTAALHGIDVHLVPRLYEAGTSPSGPDFDQVRGVPLYRVHRAAPHARSWQFKRIVDLALAGTLLIFSAPVILTVAVLVKLTSPGPVLFRQTRIGQYGRPFELLKFRSMRVNDDGDVRWNVADDDRATPVGRVMRRTSLDELPQLWNVIRGDMAIVGPRPERPVFVEQFSRDVAGYSWRHRLPVGLTGLAQVEDSRGDRPITERARFDNHYIEHWSLWQDVRLLLRTVTVLVRDAVDVGRRR